MQVVIIGGGFIIPEFYAAATHTDGVTVRGMWARRAEVRAEWTQAHGGIAYDSYEAVLADPEVNAVYLAVTNHVHYAYAMRALEAGKDILIEKPVTVEYERAQALFAAAERLGRIVFEMITNVHNPLCGKIARQLPELGTVRLATLNYSQYSSRYNAFCAGEVRPVFDPAKGGGTLLDLNVYNIHLAVAWFGKPERVTYRANIERGIDVSGTVLLEYPGMVCTCTASKDTDGPSGVSIQGEKGYIQSVGAPNRLTSYTFYPHGGEAVSEAHAECASRMCDELAGFCAHYATRDLNWFADCAAHSLAVMNVLEQAVHSAGLQLGGDMTELQAPGSGRAM